MANKYCVMLSIKQKVMVGDFLRKAQDFLNGSNQEQYDENNDVEVTPASQDPYGDPADQPYSDYGNVVPASEDPYGDPADQLYYENSDSPEDICEGSSEDEGNYGDVPDFQRGSYGDRNEYR